MSNMNRFKIFICLTVAIASFVACGSEEKSDSQLLKEKREVFIYVSKCLAIRETNNYQSRNT